MSISKRQWQQLGATCPNCLFPPLIACAKWQRGLVPTLLGLRTTPQSFSSNRGGDGSNASGERRAFTPWTAQSDHLCTDLFEGFLRGCPYGPVQAASLSHIPFTPRGNVEHLAMCSRLYFVLIDRRRSLSLSLSLSLLLSFSPSFSFFLSLSLC